MASRIGLYGGSFDPIHYGHLLLAECCRESLGLDQVRFVVANISPFKTDRQPASNKDRIEMVKLAIGGHPNFVVDTREIDRGGTSYTIDTVLEVSEEFPDAELFLLMGADALADIGKWKDVPQLLDKVQLRVIARGGIGEPPWASLRPLISHEKLKQIQQAQIAAPQVEISSSDIRYRVQHQHSIRYQVPPAVEVYIAEHAIYK